MLVNAGCHVIAICGSVVSAIERMRNTYATDRLAWSRQSFGRTIRHGYTIWLEWPLTSVRVRIGYTTEFDALMPEADRSTAIMVRPFYVRKSVLSWLRFEIS